MWYAKGHQRAYEREERKEGFGSQANGFGCRMGGRVIVGETDEKGERRRDR